MPAIGALEKQITRLSKKLKVKGYVVGDMIELEIIDDRERGREFGGNRWKTMKKKVKRT